MNTTKTKRLIIALSLGMVGHIKGNTGGGEIKQLCFVKVVAK